jgi:threonine dehydratase
MTVLAESQGEVVAPSDVIAAARRIAGLIRTPPLESSPALSQRAHATVELKPEHLQITGSFKARGSANRVLTLSEQERLNGVIAPTAGNHGLALAYAASALDTKASIFLPENAEPLKIRRLEALGAEVRRFPNIEEARQAALASAARDGKTFVSAYNDPAVIAGGGTVGLEILEAFPNVENVVVPVGGGGLIAGIATIIGALKPEVQVWGAQTTASPTIARWLDAGEVVDVTLEPSIAEGLSGSIDPATISFPIIKRHVRGVVTVTDSEIVEAMRFIFDEHQYAVEPSGASAVAALLIHPLKFSGSRCVVVTTGRNVSLARFQAVLAEH